ncbi:MAG: hypothetical protein HZB67_01245 [Candidatus Aenigmarchaeota archaeon]|nr:hypothetical protein [Candidatus Aenigmarchaeota archaeon]
MLQIKERSIEQSIIQEVKKQPSTIEDVSRHVGVHRITASKYLAVLEAKHILEHRMVGKAKLYSIKRGSDS